MFKKWLAGFLLKITGWKMVGSKPEGIDKYIISVAPHTSAWDFVWGKLYTINKGMHSKIMIKKEFFFFPMGFILRGLGAIPVDRKKAGGVAEQIAQAINQADKFCFIITPEGTRHKTTRWKKGFYQIALRANVPVYLAYIDYKRKELGCIVPMKITGNMAEDMKYMMEFYKDSTAKYPENFALEDLDKLAESSQNNKNSA